MHDRLIREVGESFSGDSVVGRHNHRWRLVDVRVAEGTRRLEFEIRGDGRRNSKRNSRLVIRLAKQAQQPYPEKLAPDMHKSWQPTSGDIHRGAHESPSYDVRQAKLGSYVGHH